MRSPYCEERYCAHVGAHVQPEKVHQRERPHRPAIVTHRAINILRRGRALLQAQRRLVEVRHEQAVDQEAGTFLHHDRNLAQRLGERDQITTVSSSVLSPLMISTSFITFAGLKKCIPIILCGRWVARPISEIESADVLLAKIVAFWADAVQLGKHLFLERHLFRHGLDDDVHVAELAIVQRRNDQRHLAVHLARAHLALVHAGLVNLADRRHAFVEVRLIHVLEHNRQAGERNHLRDARRPSLPRR